MFVYIDFINLNNIVSIQTKGNMYSLPKELADLQEACRFARLLIGDNAERYKDILRTCVPLSVDRFVYELDTFSQISHYVTIPEPDIFDYKDWDKYLSDILVESELVRMRSFSDRSRLQSLVSKIGEMRRDGESHQCFQRILRGREEMFDEFLTSPHLLKTVMSQGVLDEKGVKTAWVTKSAANDVVFLEPIIKYCVQEIQADEEVIPMVEQAISFGGAMREWQSLLRDDKFVELYEFVLKKVKNIIKH